MVQAGPVKCDRFQWVQFPLTLSSWLAKGANSHNSPGLSDGRGLGNCYFTCYLIILLFTGTFVYLTQMYGVSLMFLAYFEYWVFG